MKPQSISGQLLVSVAFWFTQNKIEGHNEYKEIINMTESRLMAAERCGILLEELHQQESQLYGSSVTMLWKRMNSRLCCRPIWE